MSVLVATPCYAGLCHAGYAQSLLEVQFEALGRGVDFNVLLTRNESHVTRARNNAAATFLNQTTYDTLFFIDADIEFSPVDFFKILALPGVRGAAVACKTPDFSERLSIWVDGGPMKRAQAPSEPFCCDFLGTAYLAIGREVFVSLIEAQAVSEYVDPITGRGWDFFRDGVSGDTWLSEDYGFCELLRKHDIPITCDPSVIVKHWGSACWEK